MIITESVPGMQLNLLADLLGRHYRQAQAAFRKQVWLPALAEGRQNRPDFIKADQCPSRLPADHRRFRCQTSVSARKMGQPISVSHSAASGVPYASRR